MGSAFPRHPPGLIKQLPRRHLQRLGDLIEDDNRRITHTALDAADVGPVQAAMVGKALLREALLLPQFLEVQT